MGEQFAPSPRKGNKGKAGRGKRPNRLKSTDAAAGGSQNSTQRQAAPNVDAPKPAPFAGFGGRSGWLGKTAYAALDLGTNNCRLLIARASQDGFTVVDAFSRVVRLGEGLATTGKMSDEAMDRAVEALSVCAEKLKRRNVVLARSVATEACRQAVNGAQFIDRVKRETGIVLDVISPKEEARLAVMGCHALLEEGEGPALIFDIGGGSTEVVLVSTDGVVPEILDWVSIPWGVVSLTESTPLENEDAEALEQTYAAMREKVANAFADFASRLPQDSGDHRLLGTSGTVTTLASVYLELPSYDRRAIDGLHLPTQAMREISQTLASLPPAGRAQFPTIGSERSDLVVAGCAILESIIDIWPGERLGVADRGIREGILRALMASGKRRGRR
ncbi:MAG: Ppx/GppA family phosphatase [Sphingomonadales bacterium]|nr:Ppx/GppA family phosphatase [Sphingomonadales bacterium]